MPADRPDPADDLDEPGHHRQPDSQWPPDTDPPLPLDRAKLDAVHRASRAEVEQAYAAHQETYQRRVNAFVKRPPDVFRIENYPPEKRDG